MLVCAKLLRAYDAQDRPMQVGLPVQTGCRWYQFLALLSLALLLSACASVAPQSPAGQSPATLQPPPPSDSSAAEAAPAVTAAEPTSSPSPSLTTTATVGAAPRAAPADDHTLLDTTRDYLSSGLLWVVRGVDGWFGDKPFEESGGRVQGQLGLSTLRREHESIDYSLRFNVRMRLPNLEDHLYIYVGRDNEREEVTDKPAAASRQQQLRPETEEDRSFFAGLGLLLREHLDLRLGFRGPLKPYAQARYEKPWRFGDSDLLEFRQTAFWTIKDRFGATTTLTYRHDFSKTFSARWLNTATISQKSEKFEWSSVAGVYKSYGLRREIAFEALASGKQDAPVDVADYGVQTRWVRPIYKDWLLTELLVGYFFPRPDADRERFRSWAVGAGLKMLF